MLALKENSGLMTVVRLLTSGHHEQTIVPIHLVKLQYISKHKWRLRPVGNTRWKVRESPKQHPSIVCNRFIPFMGSQGFLPEPIPAVSGWGQGTPWTSPQLITEPSLMAEAAMQVANCTSGAIWCSVSSSRTLRHAAQLSPELEFEPATFRELPDLLCSLSYSRSPKQHIFKNKRLNRWTASESPNNIYDCLESNVTFAVCQRHVYCTLAVLSQFG